MTQSSEERVPQISESPSTARIIPFERQSELQRAVQQRAQERLEADAIKPKVPIARRLVTFAVALIPVVLIFSGFVVTVHAVRLITSLYAASTPAPEQQAPPVEEPQQITPGVVMLVPDQSIKVPAAASESPPQNP